MLAQIKTLLNSKRTWVVIVSGLAYVGAKHGLSLDDAAQQVLVENLVLVAGGVATIVTKVLDSRVK